MTADREATRRQKEEKVRDDILRRIQSVPEMHAVLAPTVVDQDHPAFVMSSSDGLYLVRVQKVSTAIVEHIQTSDNGQQP